MCTIGQLAHALDAAGGDLRSLVRATVKSPTFLLAPTGRFAMSQHPDRRHADRFSRRAVLRGAFGAAIALPWLESLVARPRARRTRRRSRRASW